MLYFRKKACLILATMIFYGNYGLAQTTPSSSPQVIGQVVWVKGSVKAAGPKQTARTLQRRSPIYTQDTITTDKTSTGQIVFSDNSIVSLSEDTVLRIDKYRLEKGAEANKSEYVASLVKGGFRTVTGLIPKNNADNYKVNTPVATIGVRGTGYAASFRGQLNVKFYSGTPYVQNASGKIFLDKNTAFARVNNAKTAPERLTSPPAAFAKDIPLEPAKFNAADTNNNSAAPPGPSGSSGGGSSGSGSSSSGTSTGSPSTNSSNTPAGIGGGSKTVQSFCIQ